MSGSHDSHHSTEQKPVAFTVPLILASVLVLIIVLFLSLCDPKPHHAAAGHDDPHGTEASHHEAGASNEHHEEAPAVIVVESHTTDTVKTAPAAEANHGEAHH